MTREGQDQILEVLRPIIGAKHLKVGRAAAMGWLDFEKDDKHYALHLQCAFRFRSGPNILMANFDMFEPTEEVENGPSFDWDTWSDMGWDTQGLNLYDAWALNLKKQGGEHVVEAIEVNDVGDLTVRFSGDMVLEVFNNSSQTECWRFFEVSAKEHLVVTGQGIEM